MLRILKILLGLLDDLKLTLLEKILNFFLLGDHIGIQTHNSEFSITRVHRIGLQDDTLEHAVVFIVLKFGHLNTTLIEIHESTSHLTLIVDETKLYSKYHLIEIVHWRQLINKKIKIKWLFIFPSWLILMQQS